MSFIGTIQVNLDHVAGHFRLINLRHEAGRVVLELFDEHPSFVILPRACRSAEQDTPNPIGSEAPCRGRRMTRTS